LQVQRTGTQDSFLQREIFCADLNALAVQVTDPESAWAVETYTTEPGKADRLAGKLAVVDFESTFESTLRKFLPCSRRKITGGKRGKSRHSSRFRASASAFSGSLGHLFGPSQ
jgi:hypothetical protein